MRKNWVDPRSGQRWVITVLPFGYRGSGRHTRRGSHTSVSIAFHQPGELPLSTRYSGGEGLDRLSDQDVMNLLDEATVVGRENSLRLEGR